jgi:hypothetical protein
MRGLFFIGTHKQKKTNKNAKNIKPIIFVLNHQLFQRPKEIKRRNNFNDCCLSGANEPFRKLIYLMFENKKNTNRLAVAVTVGI